MRLLVIIMTAMLSFGVAASIAEAQPARTTQTQAQGTAKAETQYSPHMDLAQSPPGGKGMALLFWGFAAATVGGALLLADGAPAGAAEHQLAGDAKDHDLAHQRQHGEHHHHTNQQQRPS